MKKILFAGLCIFLAASSNAQTYGNEWIKSNQKYFKIKIGKPGIFRIYNTSLIPAATDMKLDLSVINPKKFQMFYQGKEIPIYVSGENDNVFNIDDFIEFYAQINDGSLDKELYKSPDLQANDKVSMITDSSCYYLTFLPANSPQNGRHMKPYSNSNYSVFPEVPYFMHESTVSFITDYNEGKPKDVSGSTATNPEYLKAEGFCGTPFGPGTNYSNFTAVVESRFMSSFGPSPFLSYRTVGNNDRLTVNRDHYLKVFISRDNSSFSQISEHTFEGFDINSKDTFMDRASIGSNSTYLRFDGQPVAGAPFSSHSVNYVSLRYPRNFDLDGQTSSKFEVEGSTNPRHIEWVNYHPNKLTPLAYDFTNDVRIRGEKYSGTKVRFMLPPSVQGSSQCYIQDTTDIIDLAAKDILAGMSYEALPDPALDLIKFDPAQLFNKNKLVLLTHEKFVGDYSNQYLNLRSSKLTCDLVTVQQLYNHFSYGVPHPIAIKRYLRYMKENGDTALKFLFIVGRGYQTNMLRASIVGNSNKLNQNMVPSIGVPASDNLFGTGFIDSSFDYSPVVAIGRLTVDRPVDFGIYINKLRDFESNGNEFWKKGVMHLAGGDNGNQANLIKAYLDFAGSYVTDPPFGGKVTTFTKSSIGITDPFLKQKAIDNVNAGMQLVTFLGHGSAAVTDIDIGDTVEYSNRFKYPIFYFNGCSIGNPCLGPPDKNIKLSGETFIKASDRGAIAFIAQTGLSELYHVKDQITALYRLVYHDKYTGNYTVGEAVQGMLKLTKKSDEMDVIQSRILFVQGDPSIQFFQPQIPDYQITQSSPYLYPENMTAISDSFAVAIPIENKGRYVEDSISVKIERSYPNNFMVNTHYFKIKNVGYKDTLFLYIKSKDAASAGLNKFTITVNDDRKIGEPDYLNNIATFSTDIAGNGVNLLFPRKFEIVSKLKNDTIELVAQALNLQSQNYQFNFEIDTSHLFNSPWLKVDSLTSIVGQIRKWKVKLIGNKDSTVYYWRSWLTVEAKGDAVERSFVHIFNHQPGWSQSHFPQFYPSSKLSRILLDRTKRQFDFTGIGENVFVNTWLDKKANFGVKKNGHGASSLTPGSKPGIVAVLFDKNSLAQFKLPGIFNPLIFYGVNYYEDGTQAYNFNPASPIGAAQFTRWVDSIPDSTYVALCNSDAYNPTQFTPAVYAAFGKLGANLVNYVKTNSSSYALIGKKGAAVGTALEDTGYYYSSVNDQSYIEIQKEMIGKRGAGTLSTELIGPTTKWGKLFHYTKTLDQKPGDDFYINVHGMTNSGEDSILFAQVKTDELDLSGVDARRFPNIYLEGVFEDLENHTPSQIKNWRVTHAEVPEGTLTTDITPAAIWDDSIPQGQDFNYQMAFKNISKLTFAKDLRYQVQIYNVDSREIVLNRISYYNDTLGPDKQFLIKATQATKQLKGRYAFVVKVNIDTFNQPAFPELYLVNNSFIRYFFVEEDLVNPLLDVTFNGKHITNGEIVSANPSIIISSKDENKLNWQTEKSGIKIWWKTPLSANFESIDFDSFGVKFYPAISAYNQAKAEFNPKNLKDGLYTLKVQSNDANLTNAGSTEYMVNFTVINKASATNFYPYPNPFTSSMRFVFTLTGTEVPDYINIKIMTIQGKVIKELSKDDLGNISIGNNVTDVVWDGTDQFGDRLSNGVYLYTVTIKLNGEEITQLEDDNTSNLLNADKANNDMFKHSTGKIVLLR